MKYTTLLPFVATATAFVIPDEGTAKQLALDPEQQKQAEKTAFASSLWGDLPSAFDDLLAATKDTIASALDSWEQQAETLHNLIQEFELESELKFFASSPSVENGGDHHPPSGHGHPHTTNLTVYQAIKASNLTRRFAALVDEYPDIVESLNSTLANVTIFVPIDKAFDKIPHHGDHKPPKEFIEKVIKYHILPGYYPAGRVLAHRTLPTVLESEALGGRPQRLRVSLGLFGVRINFYSKVKIVNFFCKNGVAHGVDSILFPPLPAARLISLFPAKFSTLELAAEKTGFTHGRHHRHEHDGDDGGDDDDHDDKKSHHHHGHNLTGLTVFAPTNLAFKKLGPAANAFLFNSPRGLGFLRALLAYHVVVNETLYSDAYYGRSSSPSPFPSSPVNPGDDDDEMTAAVNRYHVDLPTLLGGRTLGVDIAEHFLGIASITVNGRVRVGVRDGLAADGVVHVVDSVIVPPRKPGRGYDAAPSDEEDGQGEISVEELVERLGPYVEEGEEDVEWQEEL